MLVVDQDKAAAAGLSPASVVRMAGSGEVAGLLHDPAARENVPIVIRLPREARNLDAIRSLRLSGARPVARLAACGKKGSEGQASLPDIGGHRAAHRNCVRFKRAASGGGVLDHRSDASAITIYRRAGGRFAPPAATVAPATISTPLLPGLTLPLEKLFG